MFLMVLQNPTWLVCHETKGTRKSQKGILSYKSQIFPQMNMIQPNLYVNGLDQVLYLIFISNLNKIQVMQDLDPTWSTYTPQGTIAYIGNIDHHSYIK